MTPDDLTAPDRPEDLNPPEPNDSLRAQLLRVLDAADTLGLRIRSIDAGSPAWFVYGDDLNGWPVECARSLAAALDAAIIDITPTATRRYDHLNVRLGKWTTLHLPIETQVIDVEKQTPDDLTAPDRPEDLNPPEQSDFVRRDLLRTSALLLRTDADLQAAAATLGRLAGWRTPPSWIDPRPRPG